MRTRRFVVSGVAALLGAALVVGIIQGCGAQDVAGPAAEPKPAQCRSLDAMIPTVVKALNAGTAERLRVVVERYGLLEDDPDGSPSALKTLIFVALRTLTESGDAEPEPDAPEGQLCNDAAPPPPAAANRTCEGRRIIDTYVHQGQGLEALRMLDPLLAGALGYIVGTPPAFLEPHYEVAAALSATCSKAYCRTEDTLSLLIGLIAWLEPTEAQPRRGEESMAKLDALFAHPEIREAFELVEQNMTEEGLVGFGNLILDNLMALPTEPDKFDVAYHRGLEIAVNDLLTSLKVSRDDPKYADLRLALDAVIGPHEKADEGQPHGRVRPVLYDLLDPSRPQPVLLPLQKVLDCVRKNDPTSSLMRMLFAIGLRDGMVGLGEIFDALEEGIRLDERAALMTFARMALEALIQDEEGTAAFREICAMALDTRPPEDGGVSSAELLLPAAAELFEEGAVGEILCVADTLLFGCAGGSQPACRDPLLP